MGKLLLALSSLCLLAVPCLFSNERIIVAAFEYPPIYQDGPDKGLSGDLVIAAFQAVGIDAEIRFFPVLRMIQEVKNGDAMCGIGGAILFDSADVAPSVSVGPPIQFVAQTFMYDGRKYPDGIAWKSLTEISKYRISVLGGSGIARFLENAGVSSLDLNKVHDGSAKQLHAGFVDLWAIVDLTGVMYMRKLYPNEAVYYRYTVAFNRGDVSVVFSKARDPDGAYMAKFRAGLAIIKANGAYMRIMSKYYGGKALINKEALTDDMK